MTLTLSLAQQGSQEPPGGWKVKSSANLECLRMQAASPSTCTTSLVYIEHSHLNTVHFFNVITQDVYRP